MDVGVDLRIAGVTQVAVGIVPSVAIDAASSEFRHRLQVIGISFARLEYHVSLQLRNVGPRGIDPAVICRFACCFFDSHEAAVPLFQPFKKNIFIFEKINVIDRRFANEDGRYPSTFTHRFTKVTCCESECSRLEGWTYKPLHASCEYRFGTALRQSPLNVCR